MRLKLMDSPDKLERSTFQLMIRLMIQHFVILSSLKTKTFNLTKSMESDYLFV